MTIIKNHIEVFLVTSKKQGNDIIDLKVGLYSIKARFRVQNSTLTDKKIVAKMSFIVFIL
jgi:hypothetical protein